MTTPKTPPIRRLRQSARYCLWFVLATWGLSVPADEIVVPHLNLKVNDVFLREHRALSKGDLQARIEAQAKVRVVVVPIVAELPAQAHADAQFFSKHSATRGFLPNVIDAQFVPPHRSLLDQKMEYSPRPLSEVPLILLRPNYSRESLVHEYVHFLLFQERHKAAPAKLIATKDVSGKPIDAHPYEHFLREHTLLQEKLSGNKLPESEIDAGYVTYYLGEARILREIALEELGVYQATARYGEHWGLSASALRQQRGYYLRVLTGHVLPRLTPLKKYTAYLRELPRLTQAEQDLVDAYAALYTEMQSAAEWLKATDQANTRPAE